MPINLVKEGHDHSETAHLLSPNEIEMEITAMRTSSSDDKNKATNGTSRYTDDTNAQAGSAARESRGGEEDTAPAHESADAVQYRVYKIRWFGLVQLVLLNIIVSWDVSATAVLCNSLISIRRAPLFIGKPPKIG